MTFPEIGYLHKVGGHDRQIWDGCRPSRRHSKTELVYIVWFISLIWFTPSDFP